jgi:hypothetical protein
MTVAAKLRQHFPAGAKLRNDEWRTCNMSISYYHFVHVTRAQAIHIRGSHTHTHTHTQSHVDVDFSKQLYAYQRAFNTVYSRLSVCELFGLRIIRARVFLSLRLFDS